MAGENDTSAGTEAYLVKKLAEKAEQYDLRAIVTPILRLCVEAKSTASK